MSGSSLRVALGYGRAPLLVEVPATAQVVDRPPGPVASAPLASLLAGALAEPIAASRLRGRIAAGARVTVIVSDRTRKEPRRELLRAVLDELAVPVRLTVAIANGTHAPGAADLELPADAKLMNHDGSTLEGMVELGRTRRGTPVRLPGWLLESELIVATGRVKPHYFAGFGAGAKAIFPGLGYGPDIRVNHRLKGDPSARLGQVDGNVCRDDLEDAARMVPAETFLLDVVADAHDQVFAAVAGDLVAAHRAGVALARPTCEAAAEAADVVVTSEALPLSGSLYQASKLLAPAGMWLRPGGTAILAAECPEGTGPLQVVNDAIYRIGIRHFFPEEHIIYLVSGLPRETVETTYCRWAPSVEHVLATLPAKRVLVLPHAGNIVPRIEG